MSHSTAWACRSCRAVLGHVRDGVLQPIVPVASVDGRGVARVPCPRCGRVGGGAGALPDVWTGAGLAASLSGLNDRCA